MQKDATIAETARESARERIQRVAARMYAQRGYEGVSMREIAEAAGVTKPLVYYHFGSKEQLFSSLIREAIERWRAVSSEVLSRDTSAAERLRDLLRVHFAHARQAPEIVAFVHEVMSMPGALPLGFDYKSEVRQMCEVGVHLVQEGQRRGEFRPLDAHTVVTVAIAVMGRSVAAVLAGDLESVPEGLEDTLYELLLHGLEVKR